VAHAIERVRTEARGGLELLRADPKVPALPLRRLPYSEALEILRGAGKRVRDGEDIDTEGEKTLGAALAKEGHDLFFLTEYPTAIKPFYIMAKPDEPEVSLSFDLEYKGDEMASGGQREHRYDVLVANMRGKGLSPEGFEFYLRAFRYGMPPHGGWGFGVDRFVQKLLDLPNIREAILFPRDRVRLVP
jgi:aspartyl-tRNA synthetase